MLYICPSLYREKWLLQKLFDFPLPFLSFPPLSKSQNWTLSLAPGKLRYCQSQWCFTFGRHPVDTKDVNYGGGASLVQWLKGTLSLHKKSNIWSFLPPKYCNTIKTYIRVFLIPLKRSPSFNFHAEQKRDCVNGSTFDPNVVKGSRISSTSSSMAPKSHLIISLRVMVSLHYLCKVFTSL